MTRPVEALGRGERYLARHGVPSPRTDAEILLMGVLETDRAGLYTRTAPLERREAVAFGRALCGRGSGVPLQHLTGDQPFRRIELDVRPGVFIPRQETEQLVDLALERLPEVAPVVVDVGTGTGAIALAIKDERPDVRAVATDRSPDAVRLARRNANRLGLTIEVFRGDLLEPVPGELSGAVHVIASNPPYVTEEEYRDLPPEVRADPAEALLGGPDIYARLVAAAPRWLALDGWLVVEVGAAQAREVAGILERALSDVDVVPDLAGRDRFVVGRRR